MKEGFKAFSPDMEERFITIPGQGFISSPLSVLLNDHFLCYDSYISCHILISFTSTLKMEASGSSKTSAIIGNITGHHHSEECNLNNPTIII
jgi:hypothetical protein